MTKHHGIRLFAVAVVCAVVAQWTSTAVAGFVQQLESLQSVNGATHQWKFEGAISSQRQRDSSAALGHSDLIAVAGPGGSGTNDVNATPMDPTDDVPWSYPAGNVNNILYVPGYDGAGPMGSQAARPSRTANATSTFGGERVAQSRSAAAFYDPAFKSTSLLTLEGVFRPEAYLDTAGSNFFQYVFQTRPGAARGYYLGQQRPSSSRGDGSLASVVGGGILTDATRPKAVTDYADDAGGNWDWYYVAVTFDMSVAAGPTVVNAWSANLSDAGALTQTVINNNASGGNVSSLVGATGVAGVLGFITGDLDPNTPGDQRGIQEVFNGLVDNLTIYGKILTPDEITRHHRALTVQGVPEPASVLLMVLGGLAIAGFRRHSK
jgi:hypothetical protein